MLKKKIWASIQRIVELFTQKFVTELKKIWGWDPGSGKKPIPKPGSGSRVKKAPDPGRIRNTDYSHFKFFRKFAEIFVAQGAPPVSLKMEKIFNHKNFKFCLNTFG